MKLNLKQKQVLLDNIEVKVIKHDKNFHIVWEAGEAIYNGEVKPEKVFTNAQYNEIHRIVNEAVDNLRDEMNQKFAEVNNKIDTSIQTIVDILSRNGIK